MTIYKNNLEHLLEELHRIDLLVRLNLEKWKAKHEHGMDDLQGLYISENEVNTILQIPPYGSKQEVFSDMEYEKIETITREIRNKKVESVKKGKELRLHNLTRHFDLLPFEVDVILICLAAELDLKYEKLYSYLQDDVTKKRPSVNLVIDLLCPSVEERFNARVYFSPAAPLIKNRLVYLAGNGSEGEFSLLSASIKVDERIINYLLGSNEIDHRVRNFTAMIRPEKSFEDLVPGDNKNILMELINHLTGPAIFFFHGPYGTGKKTTAEAICRELGVQLLVVDTKTLTKNDPSETLGIILREATLQRSSLYLEGFDTLLNEENPGITATSMIQKLDRFPDMVFLSGEQPWEPKAVLKNHGFISHVFPLPPYELRKELWGLLLSNHGMPDDVDINALASKFNFSGGQIKDAIFTAHNAAMSKKPGEMALSLEDLYYGCRAQSNRKLAALARKITPHYRWEDIVLPMDTKEQLKEVSGYIKYKGIVYNDWGFDKKLSLGKGLNILFSGPSGTGKTMAAEIIAQEAGLDLYKIDLSNVVSKYIGETEKNLKKIFKEAETSNSILFFDEADALFGKRSEIKDSHDRYANIEINYLLQKMEEYVGIVILTSNFKKNIDEAFIRRMHFTIEFPPPDEKSREIIWENIFPKATPVSNDMDFGFLSKFKITGGNIKNIALSAAFLAAGDSGIVKIEHVIKATKREFQKMGKLCTSGDFGKYYELVK